MSRHSICKCDLCEKVSPEFQSKEIQVIFTTDQTEGRSTLPYLSNERIDICGNCLNKVLEGNYIFAEGAMGYNNFYFKKKK